jgi:hypothetical protein
MSTTKENITNYCKYGCQIKQEEPTTKSKTKQHLHITQPFPPHSVKKRSCYWGALCIMAKSLLSSQFWIFSTNPASHLTVFPIPDKAHEESGNCVVGHQIAAILQQVHNSDHSYEIAKCTFGIRNIRPFSAQKAGVLRPSLAAHHSTNPPPPRAILQPVHSW